MPSPAHIPLAHRKTICGRLHVFEALRPSRREVNSQGSGLAYLTLQNTLAQRVSLASTTSPAGGRLDHFVQGLLPALDAVIKAQTGIIPGQHLTDAYHRIALRIQGVDCDACTQGNTICGGLTIVDNPIVAAGGHCLKPFNKQFESICKIVLQHYRAVGGVDGLLSGTEVYLSTEVMDNRASFSVAEHASAATFYCDTPDGRASCIQLQFNPDLLDNESCLVVPYLLFHELTCHAWQGLQAANHGNRPSTRSNDSFAEGWMDVVAWRLFEQAAQRITTGIPLFDLCHRHCSSKLHQERRNDETLPPNLSIVAGNELMKTRTMIRLGAETAQLFLLLLTERQVDWNQDAESLWLKISLALNLRAGIAAERQGLVTTLNHALTRRDRNVLQRVLQIVADYSKNGDLDGFLRAIVGIPRS